MAKSHAAPVCFEKFGSESLVVEAVHGIGSVELSDGTIVHPVGFYVPTHADEGLADQLGKRMADVLAGKSVQIFHVSDKQDRHGRLPAYIALAGGRSLAAEMVSEGTALLAPVRNLPCLQTLQFAERLAGRKRLGIWRKRAVLGAGDEKLVGAIGHYATVQGRVRSVGVREKRHYLNFGANWREDFTVELAPRTTRRLFGGAQNLQKLENQWVTVRGRLRNKGGPMIVLEQKGQIDFAKDIQDQG
ncbi:MAG: thermonuclease family protein [Pseudomonadota bacterium]